jgi:hypothetical protein
MSGQQQLTSERYPRDAPAEPRRPIGVEVEDALFLDEPIDYAATATPAERSSALELFADEEDQDPWDASDQGGDDGLFAEPAALPATTGAGPVARPAFLALLSLIAAATAFAIVRTLQIYGVPPFAILQFIR